MALNNSGPLSLGGSTVGQSINLELGVSATALASINSSPFRTLAGVATGQISISNFYGKSSVQPTFFASSSTVNASVYKSFPVSSGNVYTIGYIVSGNAVILTKLNSTGTEQWTRTLGYAPFSASNVGFGQMDVNEDSSGNAYAALGYYFYKFNSSGTIQFNKYLTPTNQGSPVPNGFGCKLDSSGTLYMSVSYGNAGRFAFAKYDNTGAVLWSTYIASVSPLPDSGNSNAIAPAFDSSGNVYGAMYGYSGSPYRTYIIKLNSSGAIQTIKAVAGMVPYGIEVTSNGSVAIVGNGTGVVANSVAYFNSSLDLQWANKADSPYTYGFNSITLGPNNGIIATAISAGNTGYAYQRAIVSFSSTGSVNFSSALSAPNYNSFDNITPIGDGASSLTFCSPGNTQYSQTQGQYFALRIKNDGSQLYSYYIQSPRSPGSIIMGAQSISVTSTTASIGVTTATWTTAASSAFSSDAGLSITSTSLSLSTASLDSVTGGQSAYTVAGTYSWICPAGVTSVSAVAIGGGQGGSNTQYQGPGAGGGLGYRNNYSVTPGSSYTVVVGSGGNGSGATASQPGGYSSFGPSTNCVGYGGSGNSGGSYAGTGGGNGGNSGGALGGAGGAAGYSGSGGGGGGSQGNGGAGSGGGAGGGAGCQFFGNTVTGGYGGGGTSLLGQGNNGQGGNFSNSNYTGGSGGGSNPVNLIGGTFGAGGWGGSYSVSGPCCCVETFNGGGPGRDGAVRIIWPGNTRTFPSTNTQTP